MFLINETLVLVINKNNQKVYLSYVMEFVVREECMFPLLHASTTTTTAIIAAVSD